jgi:predicted enzyme related to lactoylglutathione lyase
MPDVFLSSLVLRTNRLEACARFYQGLGLIFTRERHGTGPSHYACRSGEVLIEFYPDNSEEASIGAGIMIGFQVGDLANVLRSLESAAGRLVKPPENTRWGRRAVVLDPDGRKVEIYEKAEK